MSSRIAILLTLFLFARADDNSTSLSKDLQYCCSKGSLNDDEFSSDEICPNGARYNIDCKGKSINVLDFDNLKELYQLDAYCYVGEHTYDGTVEYSIATCEEEEDLPVALFLWPISLVFLAIIFVIYYKMKTLRAPEDIAFMVTIACLGVFMLIQISSRTIPLISDQFNNFFYYLHLYIGTFAIVAYFAWLNVIMVNQLRKNKSPYLTNVSKNWIYLNHIYGWGVPSLALLVIVVKSLLHGMTEEFVNNLKSSELIKYGAIAILWLINCVLLGMVLYYAINCPLERTNRRVIQYRSWKYLQLFLVSGFLWIFEFPSWYFEEYKLYHKLFVVTDCIISLQGVYLFIVMVVLRQHVRRSLAGKQILCFTLPQKWAALEDADDVELVHNIQDGQITNRSSVVL